MQTQICLSGWVSRTLALATVLGAGTAMMCAQSTPAAAPASSSSTPTLNVAAAQSASAPDAAFSSSSSSSGDAAGTQVAAASDHLNLLGTMNAMQYGGRSRYGRPRYRGGNTNPDGSQKFVIYGGGGFTAPTQLTKDVDTTSWGVQVGAGRNFNKHFGVNLEFDWDNFGLTKATLDNQGNLYDNQISLFNSYCLANPTDPNCVAAGGTVSPLAAIDGYSHVWSFSLQPVYNLTAGDKWGSYVTAGVGFYHKITTFTTPEEGEECDPYYGICYDVAANEPIDSYTSNAPGIDGGFGVTYKFSHFSNEQLYAEARYVYVFNQAKAGVDASTCTTLACASATDTIINDYPQNSQRTSYIPVKFGIRF
jgi:hypothetical protein